MTSPPRAAALGLLLPALTGAADLDAVDARLAELSLPIRPLFAVQPVGAEEQRADFEAGRIRNPDLRYENPIDYDPVEMEAQLRAVEIPDGPTADFLRERRLALLMQNRVVRYRGTPAVPWLTARMNGRPSPRLVARARSLLTAIPPGVPGDEPMLSQHEHAEHLRAELAAYGLAEWTVVELDREGSTNVHPGLREVRVARRRVPASTPPRLAVHEIGVHVLRAANGYLQPFRFLSTGTAGYQDTEEGLAVYCEVATGMAENDTLRKYAARVLAIDAMLRGLDFRDTHGLLRELEIPPGIAWETTLRAFRGGGYAKDHVYLDGLFRVLDFVEGGGDLASLFVGKVRVAEVPRMEAMLREGTIRPARYLPRLLGRPPADGGRMMRVLKGL